MNSLGPLHVRACVISIEHMDVCVYRYVVLGTPNQVLMVYEHIITFRQEFRYFWQGKVTGASILFCLNRYLPVVQMMLDLADLNPATGRVSWSFTSKQIATLMLVNYNRNRGAWSR